MSNTVYALCTDDNSSQSFADFCVELEEGVYVTPSDLSQIRGKIEFLRKKFPRLISKVQSRGYKRILIRSASNGETGGVVLAQVSREEKLIVIYEGFFSILRSNRVLQNIGYSVADIALLHELLHAFDDDNFLVSHNYTLIGWDLPQNLSIDAFSIPELPQLANSWVTHSEISKIKSELTPLLSSSGPWEVYLMAREKAVKSGYPTIYSVLGGPLESFAELGAYIALDPLASSYIPLKTIKWYQENILK